RIRRGTDRHALAASLGTPELGDEAVAIGALHVDPSLERRAIVEPEEPVRVAREAIPAGHLAAAIRIHGPAQGHRPAVELVQQILRSKPVILDAATLVDGDAEPLGHPRRGDARLDRRPAARRHICHITNASPSSLPHHHVLSLPVERKTRGLSFIPGSLFYGSTGATLRRRLRRAVPRDRRAARQPRSAAAAAAPRRRRGFGP